MDKQALLDIAGEIESLLPAEGTHRALAISHLAPLIAANVADVRIAQMAMDVRIQAFDLGLATGAIERIAILRTTFALWLLIEALRALKHSPPGSVSVLH